MQLRSAIRVGGILTVIALFSGLAAAFFVQRQTIAELRAQQQLQQQRLKEPTKPQTDTKPGSGRSPQDAEIERLRESTKDLLRLRSEVTQLRKQVEEMEKLRAANAELLQAVQESRALQSNQLALVTSARQRGAILGVTVQPADPGRVGVKITGLDQTSPVARSGLMPGDLIIALDGRPIQTPGQLQAEMLTRIPGETVVVDVLRTNITLRFQVQTRAWPQ